jgi:prepilin-type N-terminal cleavage/methylation domain-containing protein
MPAKQKGFTLIEVIITIIVVSIVATMAGLMIATAFKKRITGQNITESINTGRIAYQRMTESIRHAHSISTMQAQQLSFNHRYGRSITFKLDGSTLEYQQNGGTDQTLANDISSLQFTYYDTNLNQTNSASQLRCIKVEMNTLVEGITHNWQTVICTRPLSE